jgi:hypothetical protein
MEMLINIGQIQFTNIFTFLQVFQYSNQKCWHFYHYNSHFEYDSDIKLLSIECPAHEWFSCKNKEGTATWTRAGKEVRRNMKSWEMCFIHAGIAL